MIDNFIIDPPWPKRKGGIRSARPNQGKAFDYPTMPIPEIFSLLDREVFTLAAPVHNVFLWGIDQFLCEGEAEMLRRGYRMHARFIWDKGNGVAPAFTIRYSHEYLTWFYRPRLIPVATEMRGKLRTVFSEKAREHSRKPDESYRIIQALYPAMKYMDVFSREKREGWEQFGNQTEHFL